MTDSGDEMYQPLPKSMTQRQSPRIAWTRCSITTLERLHMGCSRTTVQVNLEGLKISTTLLRHRYPTGRMTCPRISLLVLLSCSQSSQVQ